MEIYGYKRSYLNTIITWIAIVASGFTLRLVFYWKSQWLLYATHRRCSLAEAEKVLLIDRYNQYFVEEIRYLFGAPHPATLIHKGQVHKPDEDDVLHCPDKLEHNYGKKTYGSFRSRQSPSPQPRRASESGGASSSSTRRERTVSSRSEKSLGISECDNTLDGDRPPSPEFEFDDGDQVHIMKNCEESMKNGDTGLVDDQVAIQFSEPEKDLQRNTFQVKFFENKKVRYIWDDEDMNFVRLRGFDKNVPFSKLQKMAQGLSKDEQWKRRQLYGDNSINIEVQSYFKILFEEVLGPFYIFQLFSISIWFSDDYYYYATCIIIMSIMSLISSVTQVRRNQQQLRDTVESVDYIKVCRGKDHYEEIETSKLTPGDIVVVPTFNSILQFDGVLINGNVIVNESMLTGESVPITKTPLPLQNSSKNKLKDIYYDEKEHSKHTLFCGTRVVQTRYYGGVYVKALVIRVGFQTSKGELIRSIMFPKPVDFRFNKQIHKFIGVLACLALIGFTYSVILRTHRGADLKSILIKALDLITIVIPPALPAAMTIGIIYAQSRLKNNKIFCISPRSINISGCINCVCFDKTGTLTEDDLSFNEVIPFLVDTCEFGRPFDEDVIQTDSKQIERDHHLLLPDGEYSPLMICLASCHSLTIIDQKIIGDPLDLQMFQATGWVLEEPDVDDENKFDLLAPTVVRPPRRKRRTPPEQDTYASRADYPSSRSSSEDEIDVVTINNTASRKCARDVGILRQFPFSSSLQRMSVITRQFTGNQYVVYSKGAPEKIMSLCDPRTVPDDFGEVLHSYTRNGFRVLALAYRPLKTGLSYTRMQRATRLDIEKDLRFLGFLTLGNLLKPETIPVIEKLNKACIRTVMVTGDNMLTAISVANECGMIGPRDKTVLLQVEKDRRKGDKSVLSSQENVPSALGAREEGVGSKNAAQRQSRQPESSCQANPLILTVENIQLQAKGESEPILADQMFKRPERPKLIWHYVNNEPVQSRVQEFESCQRIDPAGSCSIKMTRLNDESRIHLAMTGETWDVVLNHYPELIDPICIQGTVFARMAPHQKQQLVEHLQSLEYYVGMCGDGANDSGALRAAHAGISLSDTEASVAAPFTSANANISCVPILISEGRAALVTAFGILKYMALYSLIQFCSVLMLYTLYTNFTDKEFLYEDLFIIAILVAVFGRTDPYPILDRKAPSSSLLSLSQLSSVGIQVALVILFQVLSLLILWQYPWYEPHAPSVEDEGNLACHDNYAIFAISSFQCINLAIVYSKGKPYRRSILTNYLLTFAIIGLVIMTVTILMIPAELKIPVISLEVLNVPSEFRLIVVCLALTHFVCSMMCERFVVDQLIFKKSHKLFELFGLDPRVPLYETINRKTQSIRWLSAGVADQS